MWNPHGVVAILMGTAAIVFHRSWAKRIVSQQHRMIGTPPTKDYERMVRWGAVGSGVLLVVLGVLLLFPW